MQEKTLAAHSNIEKLEEGKCAWCGGALPDRVGAGRTRKFCKASCKQRAYESRKFGIAEMWKIFQSEYSTCYLCGGVLDYASPQTLCVDHMIATVHGGRTDIENLRPVHIRCNAVKGARLFAPSF
ncbi:HNH endonuclease [Corynebacterium marquesiae]|uniref:HNH endonuclease n=1 Tax=Corynebacterium marquesiae TaxID=2913503 RepID=UPI003B51C593